MCVSCSYGINGLGAHSGVGSLEKRSGPSQTVKRSRDACFIICCTQHDIEASARQRSALVALSVVGMRANGGCELGSIRGPFMLKVFPTQISCDFAQAHSRCP
eukprot:9479658-Pyramimonas_sp.AAC.1